MGFCGSNDPECAAWWVGEARRYEADPDIAGIGIVLSFVLSTSLTLELSWLLTLFRGDATEGENALDDWIWAKLSRLAILNVSKPYKKTWRPVFERLVLSLSDQQLLISIAILTAGLLRYCSISVYHFQMILDLAWFSSNVHLTSLNVLRDYLLDRPRLRNWRLCLMIITFALLVAYFVMTAHVSWYISWPYRAHCLFDDLMGQIYGDSVNSLIGFLMASCFAYLSSTLFLFETTRTFIAIWLLEKPLTTLKKVIDGLGCERKLVNSSGSDTRLKFRCAGILGLQAVIVVVFGTYVVIFTCLSSRWVQLILDLVWFAYGLVTLIKDRQIPPSEVDGNENESTFGQIVPLLLLSSIVLVLKETYEDQLGILDASISEQAVASPHHKCGGESASITDMDQASEMSGSLVNETPTEEGDLPLKLPRRVDTESGGRLVASAFAPQQIRPEPGRRATFPDSYSNHSSRVDSTAGS